MNEITEYFEDTAELYRERRRRRWTAFNGLLPQIQVPHVTFNEEHYRFAKVLDYWPSSGKWWHRPTNTRGQTHPSSLPDLFAKFNLTPPTNP